MSITIRQATESDWPDIWSLFQAVTATGEVFAYDVDTPEAVARKLWFDVPAVASVCEVEGQFAGTYYVRPNQPGRGSHIANAGYMVVPRFRGGGLAMEMCQHSLKVAKTLGFAAMQFNFVVSTNIAALRVWANCGFTEIGRIPRAFRHATLGLTDALILYREL